MNLTIIRLWGAALNYYKQPTAIPGELLSNRICGIMRNMMRTVRIILTFMGVLASLKQLPLLLIALLLPITALGNQTIQLSQADFATGTVIIDQPGTYVLTEDISFNPNNTMMLGVEAYFAGHPLLEQMASFGGIYDDSAFGLGFFAAIVIQAKDVTLNLNGYTLEQSKEHALLQRFYSNIELSSQPFISEQGPYDFGNSLISAENVVIKNGTIGRSSHHGIHGNAPKNIKIKNVNFNDYEVAAVALNGVDGLTIINSTATSRKDVPVLGTFSSAQFIKPFVGYLNSIDSQTTIKVQGVELTATDVQEALRKAINNTHKDLIVNGFDSIDKVSHPDEYALFHNKEKVADGNAYGFLVNKLGVAVTGFPYHPDNNDYPASKQIVFDNVHVVNHVANVEEVIALQKNNNAVNDTTGALFRVKNKSPDHNLITTSSENDHEAEYIGNVVANAQALVAKAALNGEFEESFLDASKHSFTQDIIDWIEATPGTDQAKLSNLVEEEGYLCNGDTMFHVNKGVIAFKIDAAEKVSMHNTSAKRIKNLGSAGSKICGKYLNAKSHPSATLTGYGGASVRGYCFSGSTSIQVNQAEAKDLQSAAGTVVGFDILTNSTQIIINNAKISNLKAGTSFSKSDINPTRAPSAYGFQISHEASQVFLFDYCAKNLSAFDKTAMVKDHSLSLTRYPKNGATFSQGKDDIRHNILDCSY